jgi:hypothetical protein
MKDWGVFVLFREMQTVSLYHSDCNGSGAHTVSYPNVYRRCNGSGMNVISDL